MNLRLLLVILLFPLAAIAQQDNGVWTAFFDADNNRGFKDAAGNIMIEPKFMGLTYANIFDKVIQVMEAKEGYKMYYLLKDGTQFGRDSIWTFDNGFDCESEGHIRFSGKNGNVGMFNQEGKIAIPATYNYLSACCNGYIVALSGAKKVYDGEYYSWEGGTTMLIDNKNNVLLHNFDSAAKLDFYSAQVTDAPPTDPDRVFYKGINGKYYSFIDIEKYFARFLEKEILANLTVDNLIANSYQKIIFWDDNGDGWTARKNAGFIKENFDIITARLSEIKKEGADYFIAVESFIATPDGMETEFDRFRDNCGQHNTIKYPVMSVIINHKGKGFSQDHFDFLKTGEGYKLVSITLRNTSLK